MVDGASTSTNTYASHLKALLAEDTGFQGDEEAEDDEYSDEEDSDSFNSTRTDVTWSGDWSDHEFNTAENSREHSGNVTPTNKVNSYPYVIQCIPCLGTGDKAYILICLIVIN